MKTIIALTIAASTLAFALPSQAAPMAPVKSTDSSQVVQVRDGCGLGRHWSPRLGRCVRNWYR